MKHLACTLLLLVKLFHDASSLDWRARRDALLGIKRKKRGSKAGWKKVKKRTFKKDKNEKEWEWERIDLPSDSQLRIGVKYRPKSCQKSTMKSRSGDFLSIHYNGTLYSNGELFDSSILREEPFVFQIGRQQTIEGFEKGLLNMCVGEKRKLIVPSDMAYGETKAHGSELSARILPGSTLVYDVELLEILNEQAAAPHLVWGL
jgi:FKBP-type peptidyl-prolyl cis-trans isomerase